MNKNVKGAIVVVSTFAVGFAIYKLVFSYKRDKAFVIKHLDTIYGKRPENSTFINKADKGYVQSWAKAIRKGEQFFYFNGRKYSSTGGASA